MSGTGTLQLTHGCSLSNLPLFVAEAAGLFADAGLSATAQPYTAMSDTAEALASGASQLGTVAFVQPLLDSLGASPTVVVAGSGLMGVEVLAQPGIRDITGLRGRRVATFRGDPLEVLLHDLLASRGLSTGDLDLVHVDDIAEAVEDFTAGRLAGITVAEPHATRLRGGGAVLLSDGKDLWGDPFPDTVLVASRQLLERDPDLVAAAVRAMLQAEAVIAADPVAAVDLARPHFPGFSLEELADAATRQPPRIDIRSLAPVITGRWGSLASLGLVPPDLPVPGDVLSWSLLETELAAAGHILLPAHPAPTPGGVRP